MKHLYGLFTGRAFKDMPMRKWLAFHSMVWSFVLVAAAWWTGDDIPPNAASLLTLIAPSAIAVYAGTSTYEHTRKSKLDERLNSINGSVGDTGQPYDSNA